MFTCGVFNRYSHRWCLFTVIILFVKMITISAPVLADSSASNLSEDPAKPVVLASIRPLGLLAQEVVGDYGRVNILLKGSGSPHHYALSVADRQQLLSADVVLWVGRSLEQFLVRPLAQRSKSVVTASSLDGIEWPEVDAEEGHSDDHHDHNHDHGNKDPHLWLNPLNNLVIIDALVAELSQKFPVYQVAFQRNGNRLKAKLVQLDAQIMADTRLKDGSISVAPFVVAHPAYQHFVARYALPQLGYVALTPERRAGAKQLYRLRKLTELRCIFVDYGWSNKGAIQLANDVDIPVLTLNPLGLSEQREDGNINGSESIVQLLTRLSADFQRCQQTP